jgi:hypothetical protein
MHQNTLLSSWGSIPSDSGYGTAASPGDSSSQESRTRVLTPFSPSIRPGVQEFNSELSTPGFSFAALDAFVDPHFNLPQWNTMDIHDTEDMLQGNIGYGVSPDWDGWTIAGDPEESEK